MTVQRGCQPLLDTRAESMTASQPKNKTDCQPRSPRGKRKTAAIFGRLMSSVARQQGENIEGIACFYSIFLSLSLWGKGKLAFPPMVSASIISVCLSSLLPPCQQRFAIVSERPISISHLMNTERPQVVLIKKVQRLQTVICNLSPVGEGFLGKQARGQGGIRWIGIIYVSFLN